MGEGKDDIELERRLTRLESYIEHHGLHARVASLEQWRYIIIGAAILVGSLFSIFSDEIKMMVIR